MIHSLIPFTQLTRTQMPQFRVCRLPLLLDGAEIEVGEIVAVDSFPNRVRLRQMYEQRRIEPTIAPKNSRQAAQEKQARERATRLSDAGTALLTEVFESPFIPLVEDQFPEPVKSAAYSPRKQVRKP